MSCQWTTQHLSRLAARAAPAALAALLAACGASPPEAPPDGIDAVQQSLSSIDCTESTDTGYVQGKPFTITVVTVDSKKVEVQTANAYYVMAQAAAQAGGQPQGGQRVSHQRGADLLL